MRDMALAACGAALLFFFAAPLSAQLFAPAPAALRSAAAPSSAALAPVYIQHPAAPAFQPPVQSSEAQPSAAAIFAGAAVLAAVCCRARAPSAVAMAAVDGRDEAGVLSRRMMLAGLAAAPLFAASAAQAAGLSADAGGGAKGAKPACAGTACPAGKKPTAKAVWVPRKKVISRPQSVINGCNVEKACNKGAVFPFSKRSNDVFQKNFDAAVNKYKARQPKEPEEGK
jgi:hypothetical protein